MNIYEFVETEKHDYETGPGVPIAGNWMWRMYDHVQYSLLMKNSQFPVNQTALGERPYKNIILPILNIAYRSEGFDVKDIVLYVDDEDFYHLSLLGRKFHHRWALENNIDGFIDDVVGNLVDYGVAIVKNVNEKRPEVVSPLQIAFCDQTDVLAGAFALKHQYSVDELQDMVKKGWNKDNVDRAVLVAKNESENPQSHGKIAKKTSKTVEVYEVHGTFPKRWMRDDAEYIQENELGVDEYSRQVHLITYLKSGDNIKTGVTLFKAETKKSFFKVIKRENFKNEIFGRACGLGGVEELFEPQIWTNFNMIAMENMLREASKVIYLTTDKKLTTNNNITNLQGGEFLKTNIGDTTVQLNTQPMNFNLFDRAAIEWEQFSRIKGSASEPQLGVTPVSGTPLGTTQTIVAQAQGIHDFRRGRTAAFIEEIYRDWVMNYIKDELNSGLTWLDELDLDELQEVAEKLSISLSNKKIKELIKKGKMVSPEEQQIIKDAIKNEFKKSGKKKFFKIMKDEFKNLPLKLKINVAGKQNDLSRITEKLTNVFQAIFSNPQGFVATMQIPGAAKAFSQMLEASGLEPFDYSSLPKPEEVSPMQPQPMAMAVNQKV